MPDLGSVLRVVVSLGLVLALLWAAARTLQKGRTRASGGVDVDVLARLPLAQKSSVAIVRLGDQALVLGVTESRVALLTQTPLAELAAVPATEAVLTEPVLTEPVVAGRVAARRSAKGGSSALAGSVLSPQTWSKAVTAVREMTVRQ
jgi:flagellar protein FliO/FliZ